MLGENNPMYGKPCPSNNSNSRSVGGWFKGLFFRSSCELNFLFNNQNLNLKSAENDEFKIKYIDDNGQDRYYFPDFYCDNKLYEIKSLKWKTNPFTSGNVENKQEAAKLLCLKNGWEYCFVEILSISKKIIYGMRQQGIIELDAYWEAKYQEQILK